jgi:putative hemolysin
MTPTISQTLQDTLFPGTPPMLAKAFSWLTALPQLDELYTRVSAGGVESIVPRTLAELRVSCRFSDADAARVRSNGAVIALANHPTGILDGVVAAESLKRIRPDLKILGNRMMLAIPGLAGLVIPVNLNGGASWLNARAMRECLQHLASGGALLVFPAGEVARFRWSARAVEESVWNPHVARLIQAALKRSADLTVLPLHVAASNSAGFHVAARIHPLLATAMLPRELLNKRGQEVLVRAGSPIDADKLSQFESPEGCMDYLRWRTELLARRQDYRAQTGKPLSGHRGPVAETLAGPESEDVMAREIDALPASGCLGESGSLAVYLARSSEIPRTLQEIGRLRELTFRAAGEGTGRSTDLDRFDETYEHLFLWDRDARKIAGAYRLVRTESAQSIDGLYTATLFQYDMTFLTRLGPAIELGRSFVGAEYQRSFAPLLLLWKAIGRFVSQHPECRTLFGPVSISSQYGSLSRELMVAYLERRASLGDWLGLVKSRMPFKLRTGQHVALDLADLSTVVADLEPDGRGVPVLLRHYLKLGGRLLGFNVDPKFSNALDGLIVVDLMKTERRLLDRYLGKAETAQFLAFQEGNNAKH